MLGAPPAAIPAFKRFPHTADVKRGSGMDFVTVLAGLPCRIYPAGADRMADTPMGVIQTATHRLICNWADVAGVVQESDHVFDSTSDGVEVEYVIEHLENPAGLQYNAEMLLQMLGQRDA